MPLVILNFHGVGSIPREVIEEERVCWLELDHFESVLDLAAQQAHVRITVDDGNASDFELILPALLKRRLSATFFICSGRLDQPTFLSRSQVRALIANGMRVGSHGADHVPWRRLPPSQLVDEIEGSKRALEAVCGTPILDAACPLGAYDRRVLAALRSAGYRHVYTSDGGTASEDDWIRARTTVIRTTPPEYLRRLVRSGTGKWEQTSIDARKYLKRLRW
jgi:peptidoglycan/xylan/chitin deacetylase (PgdA/CDA1 family)